MTFKLGRSVYSFVFCIALVMFLSGCGDSGPPTGTVVGKVTLKGKSPNVGSGSLVINFIAPNAQPVSATVSEDGSFKAVGVPSGEVKVGFTFAPPQTNSGPQMTKKDADEQRAELDALARSNPRAFEERMRRMGDEARRTPGGAGAQLPFADKYLDPTRSGLFTAVEANKENTYNVDLK